MGKSIQSVCCFTYVRLVAPDNTVRLSGLRIQLPPRARHWSWVGQRVEARQHLDGAWSVHAPDGRELVRTPAPAGTPRILAQPYTRSPIPGIAPLPVFPPTDHPWRRDKDTWRMTAAQRRLFASGRA